MADTPLDPRYKKGFYLDQTAIAGRKRARTANIPDSNVDFLGLNERGELLLALDGVTELLQQIRDELKQLNESVAVLR